MITSTRRLPAIAAGALLVGLAQPALAQKPITNPPVASILTWTQNQQLERYPAIETVYAVDTIKKGDAIPVDVGQSKSFKGGSAPLELMVIGVAKDMEAKKAFMSVAANSQ